MKYYNRVNQIPTKYDAYLYQGQCDLLVVLAYVPSQAKMANYFLNQHLDVIRHQIIVILCYWNALQVPTKMSNACIKQNLLYCRKVFIQKF